MTTSNNLDHASVQVRIGLIQYYEDMPEDMRDKQLNEDTLLALLQRDERDVNNLVETHRHFHPNGSRERE